MAFYFSRFSTKSVKEDLGHLFLKVLPAREILFKIVVAFGLKCLENLGFTKASEQFNDQTDRRMKKFVLCWFISYPLGNLDNFLNFLGPVFIFFLWNYFQWLKRQSSEWEARSPFLSQPLSKSVTDSFWTSSSISQIRGLNLQRLSFFAVPKPWFFDLLILTFIAFSLTFIFFCRDYYVEFSSPLPAIIQILLLVFPGTISITFTALFCTFPELYLRIKSSSEERAQIKAWSVLRWEKHPGHPSPCLTNSSMWLHMQVSAEGKKPWATESKPGPGHHGSVSLLQHPLFSAQHLPQLKKKIESTVWVLFPLHSSETIPSFRAMLTPSNYDCMSYLYSLFSFLSFFSVQRNLSFWSLS